jgi:solute:Na+ symporter, SSS family
MSPPMVHLSNVDIILIGLYFAAVLATGFFAGRRSAGGDVLEYLLAGRSLTVPLFVMTLVSTWYGGILGVGEFSYRYGISNWVIQGVPYYVFALVFAVVLAKRIRATNLTTIPDMLEHAYDRRTAVLGAGLTFLLMTPAPYVLMLGILLQMLTGWQPAVCLIAGTVVTTVYLLTGGFRSDVYTDVLEFVLMFLGFGIIIPFAVSQYGGWAFLTAHVPAQHLTWDGGNSLQFVLVWFFIALWTLVDPAFHQRCYAAKSGTVAQRGILWSILFWIVFDAMTATAGLYARAILPDLEQPLMAYPKLAEVILPSAAKGLFFIGLLATIMSTLNTLAFVSATTLGRDIVWRMLRGRAGDSTKEGKMAPENEEMWVRIGLIVSGVLAVVLALVIPSVIKLWYTIGTVIVPGLLVPLVTAYFKRVRTGARWAFASMCCGWLTSLAWLLAGWSQELGVSLSYPLGIEPMYPGLVASVLVWCGGMAVRGRLKVGAEINSV